MFDSGISAKSLIEEIKEEADIAIPIPDSSYISWLNSLEQLLYAELIQEQKEITAELPLDNLIDISELAHSENESEIRFEDIYAIFADEIQLIKSTLTSGVIFPDSYYKIQNNIGLNIKKQPEKLKIIYFVRPALKTAENISTEYVMIPVEFIDLAKAKLRGEAYKLANEDALSAKWINDYNVLLETFKAWISRRAAQFGM